MIWPRMLAAVKIFSNHDASFNSAFIAIAVTPKTKAIIASSPHNHFVFDESKKTSDVISKLLKFAKPANKTAAAPVMIAINPPTTTITMCILISVSKLPTLLIKSVAFTAPNMMFFETATIPKIVPVTAKIVIRIQTIFSRVNVIYSPFRSEHYNN